MSDAGGGRSRRRYLRWGLWTLGALIIFGLGMSAGRGSPPPTPTPAAQGSTVETVTVTVTAPAPPPETITVEVPAPPPPAPPAPVAPPPLTSVSAGTYQVGKGPGKIAPGSYQSPGPDPGGIGICYYARLKANDGSLGDIVDSGVSEGPSIMNVADSDGYVEISGCTFQRS